MSEYDEKTQEFNLTKKHVDKSSSPEVMRELIQKSTPNIREEKLNEEDIVLRPEMGNDIEYNEIERTNFSNNSHTDTNDFLNNYNSDRFSNNNNYSHTDTNDFLNNYNSDRFSNNNNIDNNNNNFDNNEDHNSYNNYDSQNYQNNYSQNYYQNDYYDN
jgi:hypothetical protein